MGDNKVEQNIRKYFIKNINELVRAKNWGARSKENWDLKTGSDI